MKRIIPLFFLACLMPQFVRGQEISGSWKGKLNLGITKLNIVFNIKKEGDKPVCTMDSPDQGAKDIRAEVDFLSADSLAVSVPALSVRYRGRLDHGTIKGGGHTGTI